MSRLHGLATRLRLLVARRAAEARMEEEFRFHLDMETERHVRAGLTVDEARRRATLAFGVAEAHREEMRDGRTVAPRGGWTLDVKLGLRMLAKHPGLAIVGGLGMALATAIGAGAFALFGTYFFPDLPLHEGDRVVSLIAWDERRGSANPRVLHDFVTWRADARSLVDVGAFGTSRRNLVDGGEAGSPVIVAEMSAAGFRVARVAPLRGRVLVDADERPGAPPVLVIGHDVWRQRFHGDTGIVGRVVRLGRTAHTIVGVMPARFAFPINHEYWIPLRADPSAYAVGDGPELKVFARLAPGATRARAQAELDVVGARMAAEHPTTHARLRPRVMDYAEVFANTGGSSAVVRVQLVIALLLLVVCWNVATLVYARTVARSGEIAVRTALGATRARVVTQLFVESLVLTGLAASVGLGLVAVGLRFVDAQLERYDGGVPFWVEPGLSAGTALYALGLAVAGAIVVGVVPALRATRVRLRPILGTLGGGSRPQLGRTWTFMIVGQVAIAVGVIPPAALMGRYWVTQAMTRPGFPAGEYLSAVLFVEREGSAFAGSDLRTVEFRRAMRAGQTALVARLEREPMVAGVTAGTGIPGEHAYSASQLEGTERRRNTRLARVAPNYFDVFDVRVVAGRAFVDADVATEEARPIVVNRSFVARMPAGGAGDPVGRRVRFPRWVDGAWADPSTLAWHEIVGVVDDFPAGTIGIDDPGDTRATAYEPIAPGEAQGVTLFARVRGPADAFAPRLRALAAAADPALQLRRVQTLDAAYGVQRREVLLAALALTLVVGSVLLLSTAGMYALMSFTVAQRRREIGVRAALGADARRILVPVLARAAAQLAVGTVAGLVLLYVVDRLLGGDVMDRTGVLALPATALFMAVVGMLAAAGPARHGLRVQPTEALRAES